MDMQTEPRDSESGAGASSSDGLPRAAVAKLVKERLPPHLRTKPDVAALLSEMAGARRPTLLPLPPPSLSPARHLGHAASATPLGRTDAASPWHVDTASTEFRRRTSATASPAGEFLQMLTSEANEAASAEKKKTLSEAHLLGALRKLGYPQLAAECEAVGEAEHGAQAARPLTALWRPLTPRHAPAL